MPTAFLGKLNQNFILNGLYNMIISQQAFGENIKTGEGDLVSLFRRDGTMYGDTKLYISTNIQKFYRFKDPNAGNLLTKHPPENPYVQAITIDTFWQTAITLDGTLLKQAFDDADIYGQYCSVIVQWLRDTKKVMELKLINTYVGTVTTEATKGVLEVELPTKPTDSTITELNQYYKVIGAILGEALENTVIDMADPCPDYNDLPDGGFLRAYSFGDFIIVWNKTFNSLIQHLGGSLLFHPEKALEGFNSRYVLNDKYFGEIIDKDGTVGTDEVIRTIDPIADLETGEQYFSSDQLPEGYSYKAGTVYRQHSDFTDGTIICKIVHKDAIPFMSAMQAETEFFNEMDIDRTHYLTYGYSHPDRLREYPIITVKAKFVS